jgi:hypothetical protein
MKVFGWYLVVGEGAALSRHADLAFAGVYKTPLHGWCYSPFRRVLKEGSKARDTRISEDE